MEGQLLKGPERPRVRLVADSEYKSDRLEDGIVGIQVSIVKIVNPGEFYVTMYDSDEKYRALNERMNRYYNGHKGHGQDNPNNPRKWEMNHPCAIKVETQWERGVIMDGPHKDYEKSLWIVKVKLVDGVEEVSVPTDAVKHLPLKFRRLRYRVTQCCLGGIQPIDGSSWPESSTLTFKFFVGSFPKLYILKIKNNSSGDDISVSHVQLMIKRKPRSAPLKKTPAPESCIILNHVLCVKGFAKEDTSQGKNTDVIDSGQVRNVMEDDKEVLAYFLKETFKTTHEGRIDMRQLREVPKPRKARWFPAEPLGKDVISGKVTFVGSNCELYMQNCENCTTHMLKIINEEVNEVCERTEPSDIEWEVGDICLARFSLDSKWYRSEILEINTYGGHHVVRFVDYGNREYVKNEDVRLAVGLTMWPLQVHICYFDNLTSIEPNWETLHLEGIHRMLVDKICEVELRRLRSGFLGIVNMYLPDHTNVLELIVSKGLGRYLCEDAEDHNQGSKHIFSRDNYEKKDCIQMEKANFKLLEIPEDVGFLSVEIPAILSPDLILLKVCGTDNAELMIQIDAFVELQATLQDEAENLPCYDPTNKFSACISKYEGLWYRAAVMKSEFNTVTIQYVDYGNIEVKSAEEVKQMKYVWYSVPAHAIPCRIYGFKYSGKIPAKEALQVLQKKFSPQTDIHATIKKRGMPYLEVELRNESGTLLYQDLIDTGFYLPH